MGKSEIGTEIFFKKLIAKFLKWNKISDLLNQLIFSILINLWLL